MIPADPPPVQIPVENYYERQTLKGFGALTDRAFHEAHREQFPNNGFKNQFTGYHAAVDVEFTDAASAGRPVAVNAVADGTVVYVGSIDGYGGLIIIRHDGPDPVTSLYGHLRLSDRTVQTGQRVATGHRLAYLGESFTADTSGARKHLHFGIHRGGAVDVQGYEPTVARLRAEWLDPNEWLTRQGAGPVATPVATPSDIAAATSERSTSWFERLVSFVAGLFG